MMAEDDYTDSSSSSTAKKKGTVFGLPYWQVGVIAVVGVVIAIYIKDHFLGGSSPTYTLAANGTSPAATSSGGSTSSGTSTSTSPSSAMATWVQDAMNFATSIGMNQSTVNTALEEYTARNTITNGAQATAIHSIINSIGAAPGLGSPIVELSSGTTSSTGTHTSPSTSTGTSTGTHTSPSNVTSQSTATSTPSQPAYTPPHYEPANPVINWQNTEYRFSAPGTNNGVTTTVTAASPTMQDSGFTQSINPKYLKLGNLNQLAMAKQRGANIMYEPEYDVFEPVAGHNIIPGTALYAED